jgi:hypothetical protein
MQSDNACDLAGSHILSLKSSLMPTVIQRHVLGQEIQREDERMGGGRDL